jgi:hypothetical protein
VFGYDPVTFSPLSSAWVNGETLDWRCDGTTVKLFVTSGSETTERCSFTLPNGTAGGTFVGFNNKRGTNNTAALVYGAGATATPLQITSVNLAADGRYEVATLYAATTPTYEMRVLNPDLSVLRGYEDMIATLNPVAGTATLVSTSLAQTVDRGKRVVIEVRQKGTSVTDSETFDIPHTLVVGLNRACFAGFTYYIRTLSAANIGYMTAPMTDSRAAINLPYQGGTNVNAQDQSVRADSVGMGNDGILHNYYPGDSAFRGYLPYWMEAGTYTFNLPAGMTASIVNVPNNNASMTGNQMTVTGPSTAPVEIRVTGTIPPAGFKWDITKNGAAAGFISTGAIAEMAQYKIKWVRYMNCFETNDTYGTFTTPADIWKGSPAQGPITMEHVAAESIACGTSPWVHTYQNMADAVVTERAGVLLTALLTTGLSCAWELCNEVWNESFGAVPGFTIAGLKLGYRKSGLTATPRPDMTEETGSFAQNTGIPNKSFANGAAVYVRFFSPQQFGGVWIANRAITAGNAADAIGVTSNAAWTLSADYDDVRGAKAFFYSIESKRHFELVKAEAIRIGFPLNRIDFVLNWQTGAGAAATKKLILGHNGMANIATVLSTAPYFGGGQAGYTFGQYNDDHPGWTSVNKNKLATDVSGFIADFMVHARNGMKASVEEASDTAKDINDWLVANGYPRIKHWAYESGQHADILGNPGDAWGSSGATVSTYRQVMFGQIYNSQAYGDLYRDYIQYYGNRVGGTMMIFEQGAFVYNINSGSLWQVQNTPIDLLPVGQAIPLFG